MKDATNILFIMFDQLRWDYLSCYGHPHLETPNIDRLAARGVRFTRAYCQAPLCGPSRASIHTGRYMSSHGAMANEDPLKLGELTLGDYMRDLGLSPVLVGKMEVSGARAALARLGVDPDSGAGRAVVNGGFEPFEKLEGLYPDPILPPRLGYNDYLRRRGYAGDNPWELYANSATGEDGRRVSGWNMRHAGRPARVASAFGDRVHHRPGHRVHRADPGRPALVPPPELHQAPLALSRPRPLPRALHPRPRGAGGARRRRAREPAPGPSSLHAAGLQRELLPRRGARAGDPDLHGPRQAGR